MAIHHSENSPTALGRHRYFIEWHTLVSQVFMSQAVSLVFNGVFELFEGLKVILVEGGFSYVPHLMWRADQQYRELRHEVPWVKRMPSETIRAQLRFASQPIEEFTARELSTLIDQMGSEELVCFSTDYPHWDFDSPLRALPAGIDEGLASKSSSTTRGTCIHALPGRERKRVRHDAGHLRLGRSPRRSDDAGDGRLSNDRRGPLARRSAVRVQRPLPAPGGAAVTRRVLAGVDGERPGEYRLADGREVVKCPWHGYEYDLASGARAL